MSKCCEDSVTTYVIATALGFRGEQYGDNFCRRMIVEAGISLIRDKKIIDKFGEDARTFIAECTES